MGYNRIYSLDGMRLIASFMVVSLHVSPIQDTLFHASFIDISRIAVPFFYLLSGYFIYDIKKEKEQEKIKKSLKRTFRLICFSVIVYAVIDAFVFRDSAVLINEIKAFLSCEFWFFNKVPFCPVAWYLSAYIYMLCITYFCSHKRILLIFGVVSILIGLILGNYSCVFGIKVNGLMWNCSFISTYGFFLIGYYLKRYEIKGYSICWNNKILIALIFFTFVFSVVEHVVIKYVTSQSVGGTFYISSVLNVVFIFLFLLNNSNLLRRISFIGVKYSLYIYIFHVAIHYMLVSLFYPMKFNLDYKPVMNIPLSPNYYINNISVFIISLALCLFIDILFHKFKMICPLLYKK